MMNFLMCQMEQGRHFWLTTISVLFGNVRNTGIWWWPNTKVANRGRIERTRVEREVRPLQARLDYWADEWQVLLDRFWICLTYVRFVFAILVFRHGASHTHTHLLTLGHTCFEWHRHFLYVIWTTEERTIRTMVAIRAFPQWNLFNLLEGGVRRDTLQNITLV